MRGGEGRGGKREQQRCRSRGLRCGGMINLLFELHMYIHLYMHVMLPVCTCVHSSLYSLA